MVLELPIDVENPYRLYRNGYIDIATSWPIFNNLPLYIEIYRVGDNITANTLFKIQWQGIILAPMCPF